MTERKAFTFRAEPELLDVLNDVARASGLSRNEVMTNVLVGRLKEPYWVALIRSMGYDEGVSLDDFMEGLEHFRNEVNGLRWAVRRLGRLYYDRVEKDRYRALSMFGNSEEPENPEAQWKEVMERLESLAGVLGW